MYPGESRVNTNVLTCFFLKKIPQKNIHFLFYWMGITCSIRFMEHYLMAIIGMIYRNDRRWHQPK
jgi:hypothetical protein